MNILKKHFFALGILFTFLFSTSAAECDIPNPFRISGNVTVDGTQLTSASASGYTFVVTDQNGNDFNPEALDTDGLNFLGFYVINIPIYEADEQPGGANPGDTAVIHVYRNGEELIVTFPANGSIIVGASDITQLIHLTVEEVAPQPPIADAGPDQVAYEGDTVTLSGLNSTDPDGTILSYFWEQTAGELVGLSDLWAPEISSAGLVWAASGSRSRC